MRDGQIRLKYLAQIPITNGLGLSGAFDDPSWPRYIRTTDIKDERSLREDVFASQPPEVAAAAMLQAGDILMTAAGATIGKSYLHGEAAPACYAGYLVRFRPAPSVDGRYISYWMQSADYWSQIESGAVRSTIENFSAGRYRDMLVPLKPLPEQRRIADFLDDQVARIDAALAKRQDQIALLEVRQSAALQRALLSPQDRFVMLRRLGVTLTTGPFGTVFAASQYVDSGIPMINPVHIKDGALSPSPNHSVSGTTAATLRRHWLEPGDIVTGRKGDLGRSAVVEDHQNGWICGSDAIAIRPNRSRLSSRFLNACLHLSVTRQDLLARSLAATMPSLNEDMLLSIRVPALSHQEQRSRAAQAHEVVTSHRDLIGSCALATRLLEERRRALITAAVTGEFDVSTAGPRAGAAVTA